MNKIWLSVYFFFFVYAATNAQQVELKNNFFNLDGQKFFIKGIGYEAGALPGEVPWEKTFNPNQLRFDIERILSGGFNTIRTWAPFTKEELDVLKEYNIRIIMGIWIDPTGNFSNPSFVDAAEKTVNDVLSYSNDYDNIIAYLIMNEPLPDVIFGSGYDKTTALWGKLIDIIHAKHPGRPVSIANTCNGTYIDPNTFDFNAYNVYIYNPVTVNFLHNYRSYVKYLAQLDPAQLPLIITEYGLSVSPTGPGNLGYGGNSLTEQEEGILYMYKSLVDGGAGGSCVFNYSDGWWKAGDEFVHNDAPEEWFGLVEYANLEDNQGEKRPAWDAVRDYQSAIITQPVSAGIYTDSVTVEMFLNDTIDHVDILLNNSLLSQEHMESLYMIDTLVFAYNEMTDMTLVFNCYDADNSLVKSEKKNILIAPGEVNLPSIKIITNENIWQSGSVTVDYKINKSGGFTIDPTLDYIFYPHVGFDYGQRYQMAMPASDQATVTKQYDIGSNIDVFTIGAAFDIHFNTFMKRIANQATFTRTNVSVDEAENKIYSSDPVNIYPNPTTKFFSLSLSSSSESSVFDYVIYNTAGIIVREDHKIRWDCPVDVSSLLPGIYYILIETAKFKTSIAKKLVIL
ncbi:MAG TPA: T9SS type A sorting domain-containing protein [Bacteroidales bacterium]|nr:T9SS type A sorting domain-containing protein [Bacteroidales bacterium]